MRHVGVLQRRTGLLVKLWSVRAQHEQRDGELVELHVSMLNVALRPDAVWSRGTRKAPESTGAHFGIRTRDLSLCFADGSVERLSKRRRLPAGHSRRRLLRTSGLMA